MNKLKLWGLALMTLVVGSAKADEGMWLLQLMQQQNSIDMMKKQGLKLEATTFTIQTDIPKRCSRYLWRRLYRRDYLSGRPYSDKSSLRICLYPTT